MTKLGKAMTKGAKVLGPAVLAGIASVQAGAVPPATRYVCAASQELVIQRNRSAAHVNLAGQTFDLQRKRSSIGDKYVSSTAALIIDGPAAIFVADDHLDLGRCMRGVPVASAR